MLYSISLVLIYLITGSLYLLTGFLQFLLPRHLCDPTFQIGKPRCYNKLQHWNETQAVQLRVGAPKPLIHNLPLQQLQALEEFTDA